nr:hypothetical protein [Tanacetum cinerariifolium]
MEILPESTSNNSAVELEIPDMVYLYVELALQAEQELKTRPSNECLLRDLSYYKGKIDSIAKIFIARGQLSSDWK